MQAGVYDIVVIGGGINGAGIAADAAGRGLKVLLAEQADLASGTSQASSKLIHGGLRYLEHYEFRLVGEALAEREVLLAKAAHIIAPLRFVLPQTPGGRPAWMLRAGLFLYDHLARRRQIPASGSTDLAAEPIGAALRPDLGRALYYWDCRVDDARLVVLNAMAAAERGAEILTRTRVVRVAPAPERTWSVGLEGGRVVTARAVVNAAGPWIAEAAGLVDGVPEAHRPRVRLVKGSHIVVPRITTTADALLLQSGDGRVVFALPFADAFTMIGTTDVAVATAEQGTTISEAEIDYLLALANRYFRTPVSRADIRWTFAGVRPLYDDEDADPSKVTRDYRLELQRAPGGAPLLTVLGGKITTYRRLAESALEKLGADFTHAGPAWTASQPLPGGDLPAAGPDGLRAFTADLERRRPGLPGALLGSLARRHGTLADSVLGEARRPADLGLDLGGGLTEREVVYMRQREWARAPEDVLWRRTKCALAVPAADLPRLMEQTSRFL